MDQYLSNYTGTPTNGSSFELINLDSTLKSTFHSKLHCELDKRKAKGI